MNSLYPKSDKEPVEMSIRYVKYFGVFLKKSCYVLGLIVFLFISGHFVLGFFKNIQDYYQTRHFSAEYRKAYPMMNDKEIAELNSEMGEIDYQFAPFYNFRTKPIHGKFISYDKNGIRNTIKDPEINAKKVFMFGGSTMWGHFNPDAYTIPSILQSKLGKKYDVYNYGECVFISRQELEYLIELLNKGNIPDIVIFYDGVNDGLYGTYAGRPGYPAVEHQRLIYDGFLGFPALFLKSNWLSLTSSLRHRLGLDKRANGKQKQLIELKIPENAAETVRRYETHIRLVKALAKEYAFKVYFFWQPDLLIGTKIMTQNEQAIFENGSPLFKKAMQEVHYKAREHFSNRESQNIYYLGDIFDKVDHTIYLSDPIHVSPEGNTIIAEKMKDVILRSDAAK